MSQLNSVEFLLMNNPARRFVQRRVEFAAFERLLRGSGIDLKGKRILDAGCGSGYGLELVRNAFSPSRLVGFDLMPEQVERAKARRVPGAEIRVGDITRIDEPDGSFDAVFVFGILHHVPRWREALKELARVLAPGGVLLEEEIHGTAIMVQDFLVRTSHPPEARFNWPEFRKGIRHAGLAVLGERALAGQAARSFLAQKSARA